MWEHLHAAWVCMKWSAVAWLWMPTVTGLGQVRPGSDDQFAEWLEDRRHG